jgi:transposase
VAGERVLLQGLAEALQGARRTSRAVERVIAQQLGAHPAVAALAPIVGTTTAAVLVAVLGDPREYANGGSYLKAMGLNLKERSSGTHQGQLKITKRGPGVVRFYLYYAALRLIHREPVVTQWFRQRTDHPGVLKGRSVVALMRKLAQALWQVAHGAQFDVHRLFKAGVRAA